MKKNIMSAAFLTPLIFTIVVCSTGDGGFEDISSTHLPVNDLINNSMDVASADLDKDGDMDLVIASEFRPNLLLFNDGTGKFSNATEGRFPKKQHDSEDIALADFDQDGDTDIIFVSEDDHIHEYYLNDGKGNFSDVSDRIRLKSTANSILEGDFDKDGDIDIIIGNDGQDIFLANDGKGFFIDETTARFPADQNTTQDIEAADIDKDGDLDLVFGNEDDNRIYINDGKGFFTDKTSERLPYTPGMEETRKVDIADIDNDGDMDLFFSNVNFRKVKDPANRILVNDGRGFFKDETKERYTGNNTMHTADACFVDLNRDNFPDLIVGNIFGGHQQVFLNNGKGSFAEKTKEFFQINPSTEVISIEAGDWNKDGIADLYFGIFRGSDKMFMGMK